MSRKGAFLHPARTPHTQRPTAMPEQSSGRVNFGPTRSGPRFLREEPKLASAICKADLYDAPCAAVTTCTGPLAHARVVHDPINEVCPVPAPKQQTHAHDRVSAVTQNQAATDGYSRVSRPLSVSYQEIIFHKASLICFNARSQISDAILWSKTISGNTN